VFGRKKATSTPEVQLVAGVNISDAPRRERTTIVGKVVRMQSKPAQGLPTMVVSIGDETGTCIATWTGRRTIGAITLGRRIAITGVGTDASGILTFVNPEYQLLV
jgi:RecG-like helicase